jgi:serine O-acetyltransferase
MEIHIGIADLLVIYGLPIILFFFGLCIFLFLLYIVVKLPLRNFDFKYDLLYIFDSQKNLKRFRQRRLAFFFFYFKTLIGDNGTQALLLYRISRFFLLYNMRMISDFIHRFSKFFTDADLSPFAKIGRGLMIYHGSGVVIGKNTELGERCIVCQGVTTGSGAPKIGNDVKLWAGCKILGNIEIGDRSEVGANAVLLESIGPDVIAVGVPAKKLIPKKKDNS